MPGPRTPLAPRFAHLASIVLLLGVACRPAQAPRVYGPWEEGLTLTFEDPSQPQPQRTQDRMQVRVARSAIAPGAPGLVQVDVTSLQGHLSLNARHQDGGISLVNDQGQVLSVSLPAGFPATASWTERGTAFSVVGRAAWEGAAILPATADPIGIWVEARPAQGPRRRTLYLPNLGEVETRVDRDGSWITINRLVAYGFTANPATRRP